MKTCTVTLIIQFLDHIKSAELYLAMVNLLSSTLHAVEKRLNEISYMGIPLGSTLNNNLIIELWHEEYDTGFKSQILSGLRQKKHWLLGEKRRWRETVLPSTIRPQSFFVTLLSDRSSFKNLVQPVVHQLELMGYDCQVIGKSPQMRKDFPTDIGFVTFRDVRIEYLNLIQWRKHYSHCKPLWDRNLEAIVRDYPFLKGYKSRLSEILLYQSQRITAYQALLQTTKPLAVITEYDRNEQSASLILAAKALGIPTFTMMHGVVNEYGYTPLLADWVLCWGNLHVRQLTAMGVEPERTIVTGCQALTRNLPVNASLFRSEKNIPPGRPVILLATSPIHDHLRTQFTEKFCMAMDKLDATGVVRLHPSENLAFYRPVQQRYPKVKFLANQEWTLDESLAAADVVVSHNSGFGNDALVKGKPVIIFDVLPGSLGNGQTLVEEAGCPRAASPEQLASFVHRILKESEYKERLRAKADQFVFDFCAEFDEQAARNVVNAITEKIENRYQNLS